MGPIIIITTTTTITIIIAITITINQIISTKIIRMIWVFH